jgi:hypothetical protein
MSDILAFLNIKSIVVFKLHTTGQGFLLVLKFRDSSAQTAAE